MSSSTSAPNRRQSKSCKRCLRRKKRCHGFPVCTNCERANEPCEQSELSVQLHQRDDNYAAMQRIHALEAQLETAHAELAVLRQGQSDVPPESRPRPVSASLGDLPSYPVYFLERVVQSLVLEKLLPVTATADDEKTGTRDPPSQSASIGMIQSYLDTLHSRYPILPPSVLFQLHGRRYELAAPADRASLTAELEAFRLFMTYAIGSALQNPDEQQDSGEGYYYAVALSHVAALQRQPPLVGLEVLVLLLLYNLHSSPEGTAGLWHLVGLAMRTCIDLGLHRETTYHAGDDEKDEKESPKQGHMRRLFWTVFCLDYSISQALQRPLSLTERDMDTHLPSPDVDASENTFWVPFIQLKRLEARAYADVYSLDEPLEARYDHAKAHLKTLNAWAQGLLPFAAEEYNNDFNLLWNRAILVILRPFLSAMGPEDESLTVHCLRAASNICEVAEYMRENHLHKHMLLAAHSIFNAGVTICCCLCLHPQLRSTAVFSDLEICSSAMLFLADRFSRLKQIRDILEDVVSCVADSLPKPNPNPSTGNNRRPTQYLAEPDIVAVQSLMELSAQHDGNATPEIISTKTATEATETDHMWRTSGLDDSLSALQLRSRESKDKYSLSMLLQLMSLEYPAC